MMSNSIQEFVEAAKSRGASDEFLCALLVRQGWPANEVYDVLGRYWQNLTGVAIPARSGGGESARDAFLYLLSFSTLATWATSLGSLVFDFINQWLPDVLSTGNALDLRTAATWAMARIAVAFPVYLLVTALTVKEARKHPDRLQSGVRKWLTYLALFGTAATMIGDLICFLDYLLAGEITLRFVLKSATVMIICAGIFTYYLGSLKSARTAERAPAKRRNIAFALASTVTVLAAFCIGLVLAGTPTRQRSLEADRTRVDNLRAIAQAVRVWYTRAAVMNTAAGIPPDLGVLIRGGELERDAVADPVTRAPYEYHPKSGNRYEVCAEFQASNIGQSSLTVHSDFWRYGRGKTCFALDASEQVPW